jgi:hypothetical protein
VIEFPESSASSLPPQLLWNHPDHLKPFVHLRVFLPKESIKQNEKATLSFFNRRRLLSRLVCCAANVRVRAQNADDQVLASWTDVNYMALYKTIDGHLIYKRIHAKCDADFYERDTLSLSTVTSITMGKSDIVDKFVITISTQENAVVKERYVGGEKYERHTSSVEFQIPLSEKGTADSVMAELQQLTGK